MTSEIQEQILQIIQKSFPDQILPDQVRFDRYAPLSDHYVLLIQLFLSSLALMQTEKSSKMHSLNLTYQEYLRGGKSIAHTRIDKYVVYDELGKGAFGAVYKGMNDETKKTVAIKILDLYAIEKEPNEKIKQIKKRLTRTEPELMLICNSDNVVKCFDVYSNNFLKIIVMEYCNGGQLEKEIKNKGRIPQAEATLIIKQIINGLAEMHNHKIIHRDLKSENILSHNGVYKIADLGFSKQVVNQDEIKQTTLGTITTMAPEVMKKEEYGLKADIWSVGIIFFQMIFGRVPYISTNATLMYHQIQSKKILNTECFEYNGYKASKKVTSFLREVMTIDKYKRLGWKQLIKHPLFEDTHNSGQLSNEFRLNYDLKPPEINLDEIIENKLREGEQEVESERLVEQKPEVTHNLIRLTHIEAKEKQKELSTEEDALYEWVRRTHLECLKTQLIFNQIFSVIEQNNLLDLSDRCCIQFMYLIITRCLNNISVINDKIQHQKKKSPVLQKLRDNVKELYQKIVTMWSKYSSMLTTSENKITSIISDRFAKIFKSKSLELKDRFLVGNEKLYYTKEEQLKFTDEQYIPFIKKEMRAKPEEISKRVKNYLNHYVEINKVRLEDLKLRNFEEYVNVILQ